MTSINPMWVQMSTTSVACKRLTSCNADAYGLFVDGQVAKYIGNTGQWISMTTPSPSSTVVGLSSSTHDSTAVAYTNDGFAYINIYGFWYLIDTTNNVIGVATGGAQAYVTAESTGTIVIHINGISDTISGGPTKLSATPGLSELWGVDNSGNVYRWVSGAWQSVSGKNLVDIHVSLSSTGQLQVVGVDSFGQGWMYNSSGGWDFISGPFGAVLSTLEGGANVMWAVTTTGDLYSGVF